MKHFFLFILITLSALSLVSCFTLQDYEPPTPEELGRIASQKRMAELEKRKVLRVAVSTAGGKFAYLTPDGTFEGPEVDAVRKAAEKNKWSVFIFAVRPESLAAVVRNGKADIAIGGLKTAEIVRALLTPVCEYQHEKSAYAFAAWNNAEELKKLLEQ